MQDDAKESTGPRLTEIRRKIDESMTWESVIPVNPSNCIHNSRLH